MIKKKQKNSTNTESSSKTKIDDIINRFKNEKKAKKRTQLVKMFRFFKDEKVENFIVNNILTEKNTFTRFSMLEILQDYSYEKHIQLLQDLNKKENSYKIHFLSCKMILEKQYDTGIKSIMILIRNEKSYFIRKKTIQFLTRQILKYDDLSNKFFKNENRILLNKLINKGLIKDEDMRFYSNLSAIDIKNILIKQFYHEKSRNKKAKIISILSNNNLINNKVDFVQQIFQKKKKNCPETALLLLKNEFDKKTSDFLLKKLSVKNDIGLVSVIVYLLSLFPVKNVQAKLFDFVLKTNNTMVTKWAFIYSNIHNDNNLINKVIKIYDLTKNNILRNLILLKLSLTKNDLVYKMLEKELKLKLNFEEKKFLIRLLAEINTIKSLSIIINDIVNSDYNNEILDLITYMLIEYSNNLVVLKEKLKEECLKEYLKPSTRMSFLFILTKLCSFYEINLLLRDGIFAAKSYYDEVILNSFLDEINKASGLDYTYIILEEVKPKIEKNRNNELRLIAKNENIRKEIIDKLLQQFNNIDLDIIYKKLFFESHIEMMNWLNLNKPELNYRLDISKNLLLINKK